MKLIHCLWFAAALLPWSARAQFIVNDPIAVAQGMQQHVVEVGKFVDMIDKQIKQIDLQTSQLRELTAYTEAFGDPKKISQIAGVDQVIKQLQLPNVNKLLGELQKSSDGATSLKNTYDGVFRAIGNIEVKGTEIPRNEELYRKFGAVEATESNYRAVHEETAGRIKALKESIGETTTALQSATTDAEVQKLQGTLASQNAQLASLQGEVTQAASQVLVQDVLNRNDDGKQDEARREKNAAEWGVINKDFDRMLTVPDRNAR